MGAQLIIENKGDLFDVGRPFDRYKPFAIFKGANVADLFAGAVVRKDPGLNCGSPYLWINEKLGQPWRGRYIYARPCAELAAILEKVSIYGEPINRDIYLEIWQREGMDGCRVTMRFQQIIGSRALFDLDAQQTEQLKAFLNGVE